MSEFARPTDFPPLSLSAFMGALPMAVRSACDQIRLPRPSGVYVLLDDARREEFAANETVVEAVHPCSPDDLERVQGLSGHCAVPTVEGEAAVAIVATLRREFNRVDGAELRVFWHLRAVRLPPADEPGQLSLFG